MSDRAELPFEDGLAYQPWFAEAVGRLHLRKGARVLMLTASAPDLCAHVLASVGNDGHVTVLEPDVERAHHAEQLEHPGLAVLAYRPEGGETFGQHDALVACPATDRDWPMNLWGEVAKHNLRPGGRFVIDLPGVRHCEMIETAWQEIGAPADGLKAWNGPSETAMARLLRADGLRSIEAGVSAHIVAFASPHDAAAVACGRLNAGAEIAEGLQLALAKRFGTHTEVELLFRRTRVTGMR